MGKHVARFADDFGKSTIELAHLSGKLACMREYSDVSLKLWLPDLARFASDHPCRTWLARSDRITDGAKGYIAGLMDYFSCDGAFAPAALTRQLLAGDANNATWLCADPAWVQPDLGGARLLAYGHMHLDQEQALALAAPLRAVFEDAGMQLEISSPERWHLRLNAPQALPDFATPEQALGEDLYQYLPQGPEGKRWRVLLNEVQVILHQHPVNAERQARGLPPVNSLWFWGAGALPHKVTASVTQVMGEDLLLRALAQHAGVHITPRTVAALAMSSVNGLIDLQDQSAEQLASEWWPAIDAQSRRQALILSFASGERWLHRPWHRMRVWRRVAR